jgi:hypothetical protein
MSIVHRFEGESDAKTAYKGGYSANSSPFARWFAYLGDYRKRFYRNLSLFCRIRKTRSAFSISGLRHSARLVCRSSKTGDAMPSLAQFIVWIVMGLLGGSLAGLIMTRERKAFRLTRNMGLGLAGAIVGGLLCFRRRDRRLLLFRPHDTARAPGDFGVKVEQFPALVLRLLAELSPLISFKALGRARLSLGDEYGEYWDYGPHGAIPLHR